MVTIARSFVVVVVLGLAACAAPTEPEEVDPAESAVATNGNPASDVHAADPLFDLTVNKPAASTGLGTVTSSPAAISCDTGCTTQTASFTSGTVVVLTATARAGDTFVGWTGACTGSASTCK